MIKKTYILLFFSLLLCKIFFAQDFTYNFNSDKKISQYVIDNWTKDEGLPTNSLIDICQTEDGYIWISSYNGLIKFNGIDFQLFNKTNTPIFNTDGVGALKEDNNGTLWMTTQSNGLVSYKDGKFIAHKTTNYKQLYTVLYIDNLNQIWSASPKTGWFTYKDGNYTPLTYSSPLRNIEPTYITQDKNNTIWFATLQNGLFKYENSQFTNYTTDDGLNSDWITVVFVDKNNLLWIGTDKGLCTFDGNNFLRIPELTDFSITSILTDEFQNMWIGTTNGLFFKKNKSTEYEYLNNNNGLTQNHTSRLLLDKENSLWIVNYRGGLTRIKNGKFTCYTKNNGMLGTLTYNACEIKPNVILVGFDNGKINKIENNQISEFKTKTNLSDKRIRNIFKDSKKNIWISTYSGFLKILPDGTEKWYCDKIDFPSRYIRLIFEDSKNNIWVGTRDNGIIKINKDQTYTVFNKPNGFNVNLIMSIDEDLEGNLLVGTSKGGLHIISNDSIVKKYTTIDGLSSDIIFNTYIDNKNRIWIAANGGLNCIENGKITVFPVQDNILTDSPYDIIEDDLGNFWMPSSKGVMKVKKDELISKLGSDTITKLDCILFNKYDGLGKSECSATAISIKATNGSLWFPTLNGVATINPSQIPTNDYKPPVYIESIVIDKKQYSLSNNFTVKPDKKRIELNFNALSYYEPKKVLSKIKLEGFEKEWSEPTNERTISYTNLPPGNYTFKVKACNNDGLWNETGAQFSFKVKPKFYQTFLFYVIVIILLSVLLYLFYQIRIRHLKNRQKKLEEIIVIRTTEILEKNEELIQQKEEILAQAIELEKLSIVASETDNVVIIFDNNLDLIWTNNAYEKVYGHSITSNFPQKPINLIKSSINPDIENLLDDCIKNHKSIFYESKNTKQNGDIVWVQTTLTPVFEQNKLKTIIAIESDITKIKKAHYEISEKNKFIQSSIRYALTIQQAILPIKENFDKYFHNFIIYHPKDIVSGDFYWFSEEEKNLLFISVIDCTGHGVPGAFMSMIANTLLNEIIKKDKIYSPEEVLNILNSEIRNALKQNITENMDGMDMGLCKIEKQDNNQTKITYAGAKRPLYYYKSQQKELVRLKGTRKSIGGFFLKNSMDFTNQEIFLNKNDLIYLTTDGYIDQSSPQGRRFGSKHFNSIINRIANLDLHEQKVTLEIELAKWSEKSEQRDDITIIGIRL